MVSTLITDLHDQASQDFRGNALRRIVLDLVPRTGRRVLDLGCGAGLLSVSLAESGHDVTAVDIDPNLVALASARAAGRGVLVKTITMDAMDVKSLGEDSFDTVVCLDVLEHLADDVEASRMLHQILRPGGTAIVSVPAGPSLYGHRDRSIGHYRRYSRRQLNELLAGAGFAIEFTRPFCLLGLGPYLFSEKVLRRPLYDGLRRRPSRVSAFVAKIIQVVLAAEWKGRIPLGLSLISRASTRTSNMPPSG